MLLVCLLIYVLVFAYSVYAQTLYPIYNGSGSHYENGFAIGSQAKTRIQQYINNYPDMQSLRFCLLTGCSVQFRDLVEYNQQIYPQYFDELDGIADGAQVDSSDLYLLSFKHEILSLSNQIYDNTHKIKSDLLQCSDVLLNNASFKGFGHNEDGWNGTESTGFYAHYKITNGTENEFFAFQYPGSIVGHAFSVNKYGVAVSMNAVYPNNVTIPARGSYFICRAMLDAKSLSDAVAIINNYTINQPVSSFGASLNIGFMDKDSKQINIANVEISNFKVSIAYYNDTQDYGYHYNMYLRLNVSQKTDESSIHRLNRTKELIAENGLNTMEDICNILGDTQDTEYPLYRTSVAPDTSSTLSTALFDIENQVLHIYEKSNPKTSEPALNISFEFDQW